jgi:hypothetical protein
MAEWKETEHALRAVIAAHNAFSVGIPKEQKISISFTALELKQASDQLPHKTLKKWKRKARSLKEHIVRLSGIPAEHMEYQPPYGLAGINPASPSHQKYLAAYGFCMDVGLQPALQRDESIPLLPDGKVPLEGWSIIGLRQIFVNQVKNKKHI